MSGNTEESFSEDLGWTSLLLRVVWRRFEVDKDEDSAFSIFYSMYLFHQIFLKSFQIYKWRLGDMIGNFYFKRN